MHDDHGRGLAFDLSTMERRHALKLIGGAGLAALVGVACGSDDGSSSGSAGTSTTSSSSTTAGAADATATTSASASCAQIPEETAGPYPGDGSNGPNVLTEHGIARNDITSSFGSASTTVDGVPLSLRMTIVDVKNGCRPLAGAGVYVWHCDRDGRYSMYSAGAEDENFLRGVQASDVTGEVAFTSIFPGTYPGRWPHIHFEVYPSLEAATSAGGKLATSQLAFPKDACDAAYAADGYGQSVTNLAQLSLDTDMVFGDGYSAQLAEVSGTRAGGFAAALTVAV
jgi:protocatechuate 3,4-dioxygenase beta subunit